MREIEIKLRVKDLESFAKRLTAEGVVLSESISQYDRIYTKGDSVAEFDNSKAGLSVMRVRITDKGAEFNMKVQQTREMDNLEHETSVSDPEAVHTILGVLGYTPKVEVRKKRRKGKLGEYEVCLDEVEHLGTFVELEKLTDDEVDVEEVREDLLQKLEALGLSRVDEEMRGYDTQVYRLHTTTPHQS
jgi:adenylate cyclase class 2